MLSQRGTATLYRLIKLVLEVYHIDFPLQDLACTFTRGRDFCCLTDQQLLEFLGILLPQSFVGIKYRVELIKEEGCLCLEVIYRDISRPDWRSLSCLQEFREPIQGQL